MNLLNVFDRFGILGTLAAAFILSAPLANTALADEIKLTLNGEMEVPPVKTAASGSSTLMINSDRTVSGSVTTKGVVGTMAHIHQAAVGKNGPVIIPLTKSGESTWLVPPGAKLTEAQYLAFKAGELYINVHSAANKGGEIRGQIKE